MGRLNWLKSVPIQFDYFSYFFKRAVDLHYMWIELNVTPLYIIWAWLVFQKFT